MMGEKGYDAACVGHADGWGVRACAVALTVGKDLCTLSILGKCEEEVGAYGPVRLHLPSA